MNSFEIYKIPDQVKVQNNLPVVVSPAISEAEKKLLNKIMAAVKAPEFEHIELSDSNFIRLGSVLENTGSPWLLNFGCDMRNLGAKRQYPKYEIVNYGKTPVISAHPLHKIIENSSFKKALWKTLQKL